MSVWLTIPSARPPEEAEKCLSKWRKQGYKIALLIDATERWRTGEPDEFIVMLPQDITSSAVIGQHFDGPDANILIMAQRYPGYAVAVNHLIAEVMLKDPRADWFIAAGDDTEPDMNHTAEEIAAQCNETFSHLFQDAIHERYHISRNDSPTFGVMQPTGDRFAEGSIDRIAGSAWLGREFCRRINQGKGPLWPEYVHNFVDEELQNVAIKYGVFWQRPDLIQLHRHFQRESDALNSPAVARETPEHLKKAFSPEGWGPYKKIFETRKALGFPGSEPIA